MISKILDSHMHLWDFDSGNYPWLSSTLPGSDKMIGNYDPIRKNYLIDDYKRSFLDLPVVQSVHIQVFGYPDNPIEEARWLQKQADENQYPSAIVGYIDLSLPNVREEIVKHSSLPGFRGIRNVLCYHDDPDLCMVSSRDRMASQAWRDGFLALAEHGLSFDVQLFDDQIDDLICLANDFPNTNIVLNHLGWPTDLSLNGYKNWCARVTALSACKNVYIKLSGIGCIFKSYRDENAVKYVRTAYELFGDNRCMFGSNFPVDSLFANYEEVVNFFCQCFQSVSSESINKVFYKTASKFYRIQ